MSQIVIEVDPAALAEPDAELRYDLPDLIVAASGGAIESDGYDYDEDDRLYLRFRAEDLVAAQRVIAQVLGSTLHGDNDLSRCRVGVREGPGRPFHVVLPEGSRGTIPDLQQ